MAHAPRTPRTSVIMPVYNTGERVVDSIRSVLAQTDGDFELLVLIDASPDDASDRVARFLSRSPDARVRVFDNAVNRGVSAVRNQGLEAARGRWIAFIDSDDAYRPEFLASMHRAAAGGKPDAGSVSGSGAAPETDMVLCAHRIKAIGEETHRTRVRVAPGRMTGREAALRLLTDTLTPYVWDKLFRATLFDDVRFATDIRRAEDALVVLETLIRARSVVVITDPLYDYTVDTGGLTWGHVTPIEESDRLVSAMARASREMPQDARLRRALASSTTLTYLNNAQQAMTIDGSRVTHDLEKYRGRIAWGDIVRTLRIRPALGAAALAFKASPGLYRGVYRRYVRRAYGISGPSGPSKTSGSSQPASPLRRDR